MKLLQASFTGDLTNGNTFNVAIIAVVFIFGMIVLYRYFRKGGKFKAGNIEVGSTSIGVPIQRIDDTCKIKCREALNGMRETILAELPSVNKLVCEAVADRVLNPLYNSITRNHFTQTFSNKEKNDAWIKRVHDDILRNIKVVEWHCEVQWEEFHTPEFDSYILSLIDRCRQLFVDPVVEGCYAKIEAYEKNGVENNKEWIEKNRDYIRALKNF
jgi:hypothetical protein